MSDTPRLDRIEKIVISLEADMKVMAKSVTSMADSMEKFVEMQTSHKLLKQEMKHNCDTITEKLHYQFKEIEKIKDDVENCKQTYQRDIISRFKDLEVVVFFARKPKIFLLTFAGLYLLAIKEVRDVVFNYVPFF